MIVFVLIDWLRDLGSRARMPFSRSLGLGLFEMRLTVGPTARRITCRFTKGGRAVLLTTFRKRRNNQRAEIERARTQVVADAAGNREERTSNRESFALGRHQGQAPTGPCGNALGAGAGLQSRADDLRPAYRGRSEPAGACAAHGDHAVGHQGARRPCRPSSKTPSKSHDTLESVRSVCRGWTRLE